MFNEEVYLYIYLQMVDLFNIVMLVFTGYSIFCWDWSPSVKTHPQQPKGNNDQNFGKQKFTELSAVFETFNMYTGAISDGMECQKAAGWYLET